MTCITRSQEQRRTVPILESPSIRWGVGRSSVYNGEHFWKKKSEPAKGFWPAQTSPARTDRTDSYSSRANGAGAQQRVAPGLFSRPGSSPRSSGVSPSARSIPWRGVPQTTHTPAFAVISAPQHPQNAAISPPPFLLLDEARTRKIRLFLARTVTDTGTTYPDTADAAAPVADPAGSPSSAHRWQSAVPRPCPHTSHAADYPPRCPAPRHALR